MYVCTCMCVTRVLIHNFSQPKLEVAICVCESECWFVNGVGITEEAWEWALVNKYGKVCYTNLLTQAQVPYINFDFPTFRSVNLRHESKLGCTRIQKLLGFGVFIFAII